MIISSDFIWDFKLGDNINHNLAILRLLYRFYGELNPLDRRLLCKPIILLLVSITEAVLHDFHRRVRLAVWERVPLAPGIIAYVQSKRLKKLEHYIESARRHDFFDAGHTAYYDHLHEMCRLRNRIYIQNERKEFEPDEWNAFTPHRKDRAEDVLLVTMQTMAAKYPRNRNRQFVRDFDLPFG